MWLKIREDCSTCFKQICDLVCRWGIIYVTVVILQIVPAYRKLVYQGLCFQWLARLILEQTVLKINCPLVYDCHMVSGNCSHDLKSGMNKEDWVTPGSWHTTCWHRKGTLSQEELRLPGWLMEMRTHNQQTQVLFKHCIWPGSLYKQYAQVHSSFLKKEWLSFMAKSLNNFNN